MKALAVATTPALQLFTRVPEGFHAVEVRRHHPASLYTKGTYVVVDPTPAELVHDGDYCVQWDESRAPGLITCASSRTSGGLGPAGGGHSQVLGEGAITLLDGPSLSEGLRKRILGRVAGYLGDDAGRPLEKLWEDGGHDLPSNLVMEIGDLPTVYSCVCKGTRLEPMYADGTRFSFSIEDTVEPGDYVLLWRKPELTRQGHVQPLLKRLVTPLPTMEQAAQPIPPIMVVETHNPPRSYVVALDEVMAIHKCRGVWEGDVVKVTREEGRALAAEQRARRSS